MKVNRNYCLVVYRCYVFLSQKKKEIVAILVVCTPYFASKVFSFFPTLL